MGVPQCGTCILLIGEDLVSNLAITQAAGVRLRFLQPVPSQQVKQNQ